MQPNQETAECIVKILQDSKREDTEYFDVLIDAPTSSYALAQMTLHATDTITTIFISDDERMYSSSFLHFRGIIVIVIMIIVKMMI